jgi:hypothetical protein
MRADKFVSVRKLRDSEDRNVAGKQRWMEVEEKQIRIPRHKIFPHILNKNLGHYLADTKYTHAILWIWVCEEKNANQKYIEIK